jgi:putative acyl-CoA dehydrogenase
VTESIALALQGAPLVEHAPAAVAKAFCTSRLGERRAGAFGTLPAQTDFDTIIERAARR